MAYSARDSLQAADGALGDSRAIMAPGTNKLWPHLCGTCRVGPRRADRLVPQSAGAGLVGLGRVISFWVVEHASDYLTHHFAAHSHPTPLSHPDVHLPLVLNKHSRGAVMHRPSQRVSHLTPARQHHLTQPAPSA